MERLMLVGAKQAVPLFSVQLQAPSTRGHKPITSEGKKAPSVSARLKPVADERAPSAFLSNPNRLLNR